MLWAYENPEDMRRMGRNARLIYQEKYTPEINYHQLLAVYEDAIGQNLRHKTTLQSQ
ncbi:MAG: hypothetical protein GWN59_01600 [Calditrichae bacterium]|nr:hypothetical protein [Calditrichia bacterium]